MGEGNGSRRSFLLDLGGKRPLGEDRPESDSAAESEFAPGARETAPGEELEAGAEIPSVSAVTPVAAGTNRPKEGPESADSIREQIARMTLKLLYKAEVILDQDDANSYFNAWKRRPDNHEDFLLAFCEEKEIPDDKLHVALSRMAVEHHVIPECEFALDVREEAEAFAKVAPVHYQFLREFNCMILSQAEGGKILVIGTMNPVAAFYVARTLRAMPIAAGERPFVSPMRIPKAAQLELKKRNGR